MSQFNVMTVTGLRKFLDELNTETLNAYQIWLSSDEEGNEILPMAANPELSVAMDLEHNRLILFPEHRPQGLGG